MATVKSGPNPHISMYSIFKNKVPVFILTDIRSPITLAICDIKQIHLFPLDVGDR
jgi:hypothetical protein